ncbi:MAG: tyrosine-type recombinase/integrase [Halanaerobiales bacterium]
MRELVEKFIKHCELYDKFTDNTMKSFKVVYKQLDDYTDKPLKDIDEDDIDGFMAYIKQQNGGNLAVNTMKVKKSALDNLYEFLISRGHADNNPAENLTFGSVPDREIVILNQNEIDKMIASVRNVRSKAIIATMFATAMRVGELVNLTVDDFYERDNNYMFHIRQGKGNKDRYAFIGGKYLGYLLRYLQQRDDECKALFVSNQGNAFHTNSIRAIINKAVENAGIEKHVTPHTLRKSGISYLLSKGVDIYTVSQLAGHASVETTDKYYSNLSNSEKSKRILGAFEG